ncbi:MAG: LLM class flavin-dependent oxidoreductase [Gemmobacter sp.]|uniref:LLM class flavin-dependent oxidoreductase n=1 Tax=Gemmobacter sp. TaxID=1898957 RepID=UPI0039192BCB
MKYSVLDLAPVPEGSDAAAALANAAALAQVAEGAGYTRYWLAEHHNMPGIASAATAVVIGHVAAATRTIRVGAGGIMLPNHAPLVVAEQFGTLATLFPGRIDLGLGRAPGTDQATARALRRYMAGADTFPDDVVELLGYLGDATDSPVRAYPGTGTHVPLYILGSSTFGAQLAAYLGLPFAFASHFAPDFLHQAVQIYRAQFRPSGWLDRPYVIMGMGCFAAETDERAAYLRSSMQLAFANLRTGRPGKLPRPVEGVEALIPPSVRAGVDHALSCSVTGGRATLRDGFARLTAPVQPDEVILASQIHDPQARAESYRIAAEVLAAL